MLGRGTSFAIQKRIGIKRLLIVEDDGRLSAGLCRAVGNEETVTVAADRLGTARKLLAAVAYGAYLHLRARKQMRVLDEMLDKAMDGNLTESCFDESELSYLENKLWKYLSSAESSARKTSEEKAKIKTLVAHLP